MKKLLLTSVLFIHALLLDAQSSSELNVIEFTVFDTVQIESDKFYFNLTVSDKKYDSYYDYYGKTDVQMYDDDDSYSDPSSSNKNKKEPYSVSLAKAEKLIKDMKVKQIQGNQQNLNINMGQSGNSKTFYLEFSSLKALTDFIEKAKDLKNIYGNLSGTELSEQKRKKAEERLMQKLSVQANAQLQSITKTFGIMAGKIISLRFFDDSYNLYYGYGDFASDYYTKDLMYYANQTNYLITIKKSATIKYELK